MKDNKTMGEMDGARFAALVEAYGAELSRWPQTERLLAHDYAEANPEMAALLADAHALDTLLAAATVTMPARLEGRVLAQCALPQHGALALRALEAAPALKDVLHMLWPGSALWKPASIFASALVMGAVLALNVGLPTASSESGDEVLALATPILAQDIGTP